MEKEKAAKRREAKQTRLAAEKREVEQLLFEEAQEEEYPL